MQRGNSLVITTLPRDTLYFVKALVTNQVARFLPSLYVRLVGDTGRGSIVETPEQIADYFRRCFDDYRRQLRFGERDFRDFLDNKKVLEYGPGDTQAVALLLYAHGARIVHGVDRFPLQTFSSTNARVYELLLDSLEPEARRRAMNAFAIPGRPHSGFNPEVIRYFVTTDGLCGSTSAYDLIISRAVLEHVNNLGATLADIARALVPGGISVHQVDLKSHGLDRDRPLDFLSWSTSTYNLMYSHKGFPNRWRVDRYKLLACRTGLQIRLLEPTEVLDLDQVEEVRPSLARPFRRLAAEDLSWLGFWIVFERST